jgi:type IV pilus assembly protein PilC
MCTSAHIARSSNHSVSNCFMQSRFRGVLRKLPLPSFLFPRNRDGVLGYNKCMRYRYIATRQDGSVVRDTAEAEDVEGVLQFLASQGLKPVSVERTRLRLGSMPLGLFRGRITVDDQIFLSRYLALMLKIGTSLLQAVNILIEDFRKPAVREFLLEIRTRLERGQPFHTAFARYPGVFGSVYINLVKAGEASGNLEKVFESLSVSLVKEKQFKDQVRGALMYPSILLGSSLILLFFIVTFSLPKIANVFLESGVEPPVFSKIVFSVGFFFGSFGMYIFGALVVSVVATIFLYRRSLKVRRVVTDLLGEMPVVRDLVRKMAIQRFAATSSLLIKAGIPLTKALEITADVVGHVRLRDALKRIANEGLAKGLLVGEAFRREVFFPQTVVNLIAISEKAGHIDDVLATLGDFYTTEIDNSLKTLVAFLEPLMLFTIGFFIGFIALAVIVPIFQLTAQF